MNPFDQHIRERNHRIRPEAHSGWDAWGGLDLHLVEVSPLRVVAHLAGFSHLPDPPVPAGM